MPVSPGTIHGSDTRVQSKEWDFQGQGQKSEITGRCGVDLASGGFCMQKGMMHPQPGT